MNYLLGLRKFILASAALVGGFWLAQVGKDLDGYALMCAVVLGFYSGANVGGKYVQSRFGNSKGDQ